MSNVKKRHWAFILYPESAPADWIERLKLTGLRTAISPIHDKDKEESGEYKKPHYHIILSYDGPVTFNNVKTITDELKQPHPQYIGSVKGYYRYLTHKDDIDKAQYDEAEIQTLNNFNIMDFAEYTKSEILAVKINIIQFINQEEINSYRSLINQLLEKHLYEELELASKEVYFFDKYISSSRRF